MRLIKVLGIKKFTLAIFYTSAEYYQYSIIDDCGFALETFDIFWTSEAAEQEAREIIGLVF